MVTMYIHTKDGQDEELYDVSLDVALKAFDEFPWSGQLSEGKGAAEGAPGIALVQDDGRALFVYAPDESTFCADVTTPMRTKIMWVFPVTVDTVHTAEDLAAGAVRDMLQVLFEAPPEEFAERIESIL